MSGNTDERIASGLGWFSLGLGAAQLVAPGALNALIGAPNTDTTRSLQRVVGLREVVAGIGILTQPRPAGWLWGRVAGDVMDLVLLGSVFTARGSHPARLTLATMSVLGVTVLDFCEAIHLTRTRGAARSTSTPGGIHTRKVITVGRSPGEAYQFWHTVENLPRFMRHLESVETRPNGRSRWRAKGPAGTVVEWDAETVADRQNELIAWRSLPGSSVEHAGVVRFVPAPGGRGTEVRVELRYDPPAGALGATIAALFGKEPGQEVAEDLRAFKQVMEVGEIVRSDASVYDRPHSAQPPKEPIQPEVFHREQSPSRTRSSDQISADAQTIVTTGGTR